MPYAVLLQAATWSETVDRLAAQAALSQQGAVVLLIAVAVALAGWLVAGLASRLVRVVLRAARFNQAMARMIGHAPVHEPASIAAWSTYWAILVTGVVLAFDAMGYGLSASLSDRLREVLPRVLASALLLVAGVLLAMGLGAVTRRFFESAGIRGGRLRGQVVTAAFTLFAALLALEQLGFAAQFVMAVGVVGVAALGLGLALAFGLGCRDLARDFLVEYLKGMEEEGRGKSG
jgi:hypothetical protein